MQTTELALRRRIGMRIIRLNEKYRECKNIYQAIIYKDQIKELEGREK